MRLIIKEKKQIREMQDKEKSLEFLTKVDPQAFLNLAPPEKTIKTRAEKIIGKFDPNKAGTIFLGIDPKTGKVIEHGGRARSQAAINSGFDKIDITIKLKIGSEPISWAELPEKFYQQDNGLNSVNKNTFNLIGIPKEEPYIYKRLMKFADGSWRLMSILHNKKTLGYIYKNSTMPENIKIAKIKQGKDPNSNDLMDFDILDKDQVEKLIN